MPPKAARGAARGRGRGRGKATVDSEESHAPAIASEQFNSDQPSTSAAFADVPTNTTPQHLLNESEPSPNSSPATIPTETPASTPARPGPAQTESSNSNAPHNGPLSFSTARGGRGGRGAGAARGGVRGGAAPAPAPSRFKPKNVRRDASELEEIGRKELDRLAAIAAENAREASRQARGRGRPPRGRGDAMGRGGFGRKSIATGTFGIAPESMSKLAGVVCCSANVMQKPQLVEW